MTVKRYDIVEVNFFGTIDSEQGGIRPAIVVQNNVGNLHSTTTIVMPMTTRNKNPNQPTHTLIKRSKENGLIQDSLVLGEQMRVISNKRIIKKLGHLVDDKDKNEIRRIYLSNFGE